MDKHKVAPVNIADVSDLVDDYRRQNRFGTRAAAVRHLIIAGLHAESKIGRFDEAKITGAE